jgi:hypothetical protein
MSPEEWLKQQQKVAPVPAAVASATKSTLSPEEWLKQQPPEPAAAPPAQTLGILESIGEMITGSRRATPESQALPEWTGMPELNQMSVASFKTALGTLLSNPQETVNILKANFPDVGVRQDAKGNFILKSSVDQKEYVIPPGFAVGDIPRAIGGLAAFTPAGRAATIPGAIGGAAATQAVIEATQAGTGGEFNPAEVAVAGALGPAGQIIQRAAPAIQRGVRAVTGRAAAAPAAVPPPQVSIVRPPAEELAQRMQAQAARAEAAGTAQQAPMAAAPTAGAAAPLAATEAIEQVAEETPTMLARKAAEGGFGAKKATSILAEKAEIDPKVLQAAQRLGIDEYLQPDHLTTSQAYRELAQAAKSIPGSQTRAAEIEGLNLVGERADRLIAEIGGTTDLSKLNSVIRGQLDTTVNNLSKQADSAYDALRQKVPLQTRGDAANVLDFLSKRADDLDGAENLSSLEKMVRNKLTPKPITDEAGNVIGIRQPTYALIDDVRRDVGAASRQSGPFADADTGLAKKLYELIDTDQFSIAQAVGQGESYRLAKSLVNMRKGFEDDMVALFGKQLDQSLVGKLESATMSLSKGDAEKLSKILTAIPKDSRQMVVASALNTAFGKATQNGKLNFNTYAKWYEGLLQNKQAYAALMTNLPQSARKQLSDLYRVSSNASKATRERITTGRIQAVQQELQGADNLLANIYGVAKRAAIGLPIEAATTAVGLPGAGIASGITAALTKGKPNTLKAADELLASPEFQKLVIESSNPSNKALRATAKSRSFKKFADSVKIPVDLDARIAWLQNSMQATAQAAEPQVQP